MKKLLVLVAAAVAVGVAFAERTAKAVFDGETKILSFYYDEVDYSGDGITVYAVPENGTKSWSDASSLTQVVFDVSFKDFRPRSLMAWFSWQGSGLKSFVGLENLNTSETTSMNTMFRYIPVTELDLSHFDWQKVKDIGSLVNSCTSLKTVYVAPDFALRPECTLTPFSYNYALVGGKGTKYNQDGIGAGVELARIDNPPDELGYFTEKAVELPPEIYSVTQTFCSENALSVDVRGRFWVTNGTLSVTLKAGGETAASLTRTSYGSFALEGLEPSTEYQVVVKSTNQYGETVDDTLKVTTLDPPSERWFYDKAASVVSNDTWRFAATVAKNTFDMTVSTVQGWPDELAALDFSKQVADADGFVYTIVTLNPAFGADSDGKHPQCERVGELTFPSQLVTISGNAFSYCPNLMLKDGFPATLDAINGAAFKGVSSVAGDLVFENLSSIAASAFQSTDVRSVTFGPKFTYLGGNYGKGAFQGCANLTNVTFHADSRWRVSYGANFSGCSNLKELNLRGFLGYSGNTTCSIWTGSGVTKVIFPDLISGIVPKWFERLGGGGGAVGGDLATVVFEGVLPEGAVFPWYYSDNRVITTYVLQKNVAKKNAEGKCWLDCAANGQIARKGTTWSSDCVSVADLSKRPLLAIPDPGLMLIVR